ncbi:MAG: calcium-translocating P-type ATPase, PMCA-type [Methanobrevibacter sp.]|nr:calcium-translocating P-type ATPase, PMCA-type [Methanobrevibacter sp.]MBE6489601.1 calcium-translocating P-type ATPase, PMCA-type [Methanobrevibacter sp.]
MSDILTQYNTRPEGLKSGEIQKRQKEYGLNELDEKKPTPLIVLFFSQFVDILIALLIIAAIASLAIGDVIDAGVIMLAVMLNVIMGFIQEYRSMRAVESLKGLITKTAIVRRDNKIAEIDAKDLTVGDIVMLEEGLKVPADLHVIEAKHLSCDESNLTGESEAVKKQSDDTLYMDSNILSGNGVGVVKAIGMQTEIGKIADIVQEEDEETPLARRVGRLGKILSAIAIVVCIAIFILEMTQGIPIVETFMTAVSLAVAAIPEGLPAVLTLTLALGMNEMAKSNAIVKRLLSVETLGSCTVICSDKTGTLTENRMTVVESFYTNRDKTHLIGKLCNNAVINGDEIIGDQTDGAILKYCRDHDCDLERVDEIPLDSDRKMMTTIHRLDGENDTILSKGAPEIILDKCKYIDNDGSIEILNAEMKEKLLEKVGEMSGRALRVIGFAYKSDDGTAPEENLTFAGLLGLIDPPKKDAKKSVRECIDAGITVVMITGDHEKTACAIARNLGILTDGKIVTGQELEEMSDEEYLKEAPDIQVYARVKPAQKMRIVETLKKLGNIVAMTGDGVNDAPALKKASIGVSMGNGTDVAKEASDMIVQNNDFRTIVKAIEGGRKIYDNIKRFVKYQVSTNVGAILTIIGTSLLNLPLPFNPAQLLWLNIVMDGPPAQMLGIEGPERDLMKRPPEVGDILTKNILIQILFLGIVMAVGTICVFSWEISKGSSTVKAMTVAFTLFVVYQLLNAFNGRANSEKSSRFLYIGIIISFLLQLLILYIPQLQIIFRTTAIGITDWIVIIVVASTILIAQKIMNKVMK